MNKFVIVTDSCSDLPLYIVKSLNLTVIPMHFTIDGKSYINDLAHKDMDIHTFYDQLRNKKISKTSQITFEEAYQTFESLVKEENDILCISFSSALSGTINSMNLAKNEIVKNYPNCKVEVVDSLCASLGEGYLVYLVANKVKNENLTLEQARDYAEEIKLKVNHYFTVDELGTLKRGGRLSATKAFLANLLNLKPILHVAKDGKLVPIGKKFGRKSSIASLVTYFKEKGMGNDTVFISHGDCPIDANELKTRIVELNPHVNVVINEIGPVIGSHSGPGTLAIYFLADER